MDILNIFNIKFMLIYTYVINIIGLMIRNSVLGNISIRMENVTSVNGRRILKMVKEFIIILMVLITKVAKILNSSILSQ